MKMKTSGKFWIVTVLLTAMLTMFGFGSWLIVANADSESTGLVVTSDKIRCWNNETATFTLTGGSDSVEWYVNDQLQEGENGSTFELKNPAKGENIVYAKSGDDKSNECSIVSFVSYGDLMNSLKYVEGKTLLDDLNSYAEGPYVGIGAAEHFSIVKDGDNGYFKSIGSAWGGSPWMATAVDQFDLVDNYEVSVDVMYPDGVNGISGFQIGGAVDGNPYEIACIHFMPNGNEIIYVNGNGGQIVNSSNPSLGGVYNTFEIKQGEWFRFRMIKLGSEFYYFVDDTLLVQQTIDFNYTKLLGVAFIQFLENGAGLCYDNIFVGGLEVGEAQDIAVTEMVLRGTTTYAAEGEIISAMLDWAPYNAKLSTIDWYVNDQRVEGQNGAIFNYTCTEVGTLKIQAKSGNVVSEEMTVTVGAKDSIPVLSVDKVRLWNDETATFTLVGGSSQVEWYVNDQLQEGVSGHTFKLENPVKGEYRVYAKSGGGMSNVCNVFSLTSYGDLMNSLKYVEGKTLLDDLNSYAEGPYVGIGGAEHFSIVKDGDNGYLKSIVSAWGGSPWLATAVEQFDLVDNYEVSVDIMYPDGVNGISGFQIGGAVDGNPYEIACIHFMPNGNEIIYVNGNGGQIVNSSNPSLGGVYNTFEIKQGEWFRFRMIKLGSEFYYFVDDTLLVQQTIDFNYTKLLGVAFIQFLENGEGLCYDNIFVGGLEVGEAQDIPVTSLELSTSTTEGTVGNMVAATVNWAPYNAKLSAIEWYVNDKLVEGQNGAIFNYLCDAPGQIKIQAKCGDITSEAKVIFVEELRPFEIKDTTDWEVLREENFDYWPAGASWGANNPDVLKGDGNGAVEHQAGEPYGKCGMFWDIGTGEFPVNYELSMDFKFKENSAGRVRWAIQGFFADSPDKEVFIDVCKAADSAYVIFTDNANGTTLIDSRTQSLGGYGIDLSAVIEYNEWYTLTVYKYGDGVALYIDGTMIGGTQFTRSTASIANYCIITTYFPDQLEAGCYIDNAKIRVEKIAGKDVETVTVSSSANSVKAGETVVLTATVFPLTAEYTTIAWYVNDEVVADATGLEYEFSSDTAGEYKIKCMVDGMESLEKTVTVTAKENNSSSSNNDPNVNAGCNSFNIFNGCNGSLTASLSGLSLIIGGYALIVLRKKKNK